MTDPEHDIDRVLSALGQPDPPADLEARVLRHLAAQPLRTASPPRWLRWQQVALSLAAAAVLFTMVSVAHHERRPTQAQVSAKPAAVQSFPHRVSPEAVQTHTIAQVWGAGPVAESLRKGVPALTPAGPEAPITDFDTASFPAPPMPLTEQEKLLIQVARRGEPQDVDRMTLVAMVKMPDRDLAAFDRLFTMPEPADPAATPPATPDTPPPEPPVLAEPAQPAQPSDPTQPVPSNTPAATQPN